ncbi:MAG: dihydroorotase [Spirosomaceae bacterium]|nr:dihydroorotase [Spirosomataceae bacterium]
MSSILILNALVVNEGKIEAKDVFIKDGIIEQIGNDLMHQKARRVIDATGKYLMPGVIDDQVHFREPGLTHKANIYTESKAAVAGGVTTFMEMPNTVPNALTQELLQDKYNIAENTSLANYSFYMGTSNENYDELMKTDIRNVCGLKIFMGSSTGNMLVDSPNTLEKIFATFPTLIATHCEDEATVKARLAHYKEEYKEGNIPYDIHAIIRNEEACYKSSSFAAQLAKKHKTRLHILHISTSEELALFEPQAIAQFRSNNSTHRKHITSEACVHHLWFDAEDYKRLGTQIKCNPAIKHNHRENILQAILDDRIDVIATDHAPHTWDEKSHGYWDSHAGLPLVQHTLNIMLEFYKQGKISLEKIAEKMSHAVADCFEIERRGYIREGYWADLVLVDLNKETTVNKENILYKCGWSPLEGTTFQSAITHTIVSGHVVYSDGKFDENTKGKRLTFDRQ